MSGQLLDVTLVDLVGLVGVMLYTSNYFLVSVGRVDSRAIGFFVRNGLAAVCVLFSLLHDFNITALTIQVIYIGLSLVGIAARLRQPIPS